MNDTLSKTGISFWKESDFKEETVILRDGRNAVLWVEKQTGHGILDEAFWEKEDFYENHYRQEFTADLGKEVENLRNLKIYDKVNEKQYQKIAPYLSSSNHYLELGPSFGGVFGKVVPHVTDSWAVEPNQNDAHFLRTRFPKATIINSVLEKAALPCGYFSFAAAFEVLEHTATPCFFLKKCSDALIPGGRILLEVPNRNDILYSTYRISRYQTFFYHKAHIHYYTPQSLSIMLHQNGFVGDVSSFLMYPFFNHVYWAQNNKPQGSGETALNLCVPVNLSTTEGARLNEFWQKCETEYDHLVNSMMLGDCLIFSGVKKG